MATVARLNQVASQTPSSTRKRPRTWDLQDATPRKRRAIEDDTQRQHPTGATSTASKSATRLRSRSSLPASTPAPKPRSKDVYQLQDSPEQNGGAEDSTKKPREEKKGVKKKRQLNRNGNQKISSTEGFDRQRVNTINPISALSKVTLSTIDSPAKNTRAKRAMPLKKLDVQYLKVVPLDAEPGREASPELGNVREQESPPPSGQPDRGHNEVDSEDGVEETDHNDKSQSPSLDITVGDAIDRTENRVRLETNLEAVEGDIPAAQGSSWQQPITELDKNYMMRDQERKARQKQPESKESKAKQREATSSRQANGSKESDTREGRHPQIEQEEAEADEHTDPDEDEEGHSNIGTSRTRADPTKKKRRAKMTEEEKNAKKEAAARRRQENADETEKANAEDFDARAKKFIEGIEDMAMQVGGLEVWSKLGAGARTITATPVANKAEMEEARAQNLWTKLKHLKNVYSGEETADEKRISHAIRRLRERSTWAVLTREDNIKPGDTTVIDIYEQLIPLMVEVLREALKERFVVAYESCWRELRDLTEIAIGLCDVASAWQPRPSDLEAGIRRQVRQNIRPSLVVIQNIIRLNLAKLEVREKMKNQLAAFSRRQELKKEEKRRAWEQMNLQCPSHQLPQPGGYVLSKGGSQRAMDEVEQVEESHEHEGRHHTSHSSSRGPPQSFLRRQPTEEIPAPDPNTTWSEKENVALLNGLQEYLNEDRYARIMEDPKFARALSEKDVDQCMARARFYQAGCSQILKEKVEAGDRSFDWLRTV